MNRNISLQTYHPFNFYPSLNTTKPLRVSNNIYRLGVEVEVDPQSVKVASLYTAWQAEVVRRTEIVGGQA